MHCLRRSIVGKLGGIAAIYAMLLLSLAPAVSQALKTERFDALLASVCASGQQASHEADHHALTHLQACGYCDLAAHAPTPPAFAHALAALSFARESFAVADAIGEPHRSRFGDAQPRAPPALA